MGAWDNQLLHRLEKTNQIFRLERSNFAPQMSDLISFIWRQWIFRFCKNVHPFLPVKVLTTIYGYGGWSRTPLGISEAVKEFRRNGRKNTKYLLILITDGESNGGGSALVSANEARYVKPSCFDLLISQTCTLSVFQKGIAQMRVVLQSHSVLCCKTSRLDLLIIYLFYLRHTIGIGLLFCWKSLLSCDRDISTRPVENKK